MRNLFIAISLLAAAPMMGQTAGKQAAQVRDNALTATLQPVDGGQFRTPSRTQPRRDGIETDKGIIYETPKGTEHARQLRDGFAFRNTSSGVVADQYEYAVGRYVEGDDGCLYIYEPFNTLATQSWLKLEKLEDDRYVAHTPQPIYENNGQLFYASWYKMARIDGSTYGFVPDSIDGKPDMDMYFTMEDGVLQVEDQNQFEDTRYPSHMLCLTNALDEWVGYGDAQTRIAPMQEQAAQLPEGVEPQVYILETTKLNSITEEESTVRQMTLAAIDGEDIYFQNPSDTLSWLKGTFDGSRAVLRAQYAGANELESYHLWMKPATYTVVEDEQDGFTFHNRSYAEADELVLHYNAELQKFYTDGEVSATINVRPLDIYYIQSYDDPVWSQFTEQVATPVPPVFRDVWGYAEDTGSGIVQFFLIPKGTQNEPLSTDNLYYRFYLDDEQHPYPFTAAVYDGLEQDMDEVPYDFSDNYYFFSTNDNKVFFYYFNEQQYSRIGLQAVYHALGTETRSDITWMGTDVILGIQSATGGEAAAPAEYFDLQGRRLREPLQKGVTIVRQGGKATKRVAR